MQELYLICRVCGHEEHGEGPYRAAVYERMREHVAFLHADRSGPMSRIVLERRFDNPVLS
jgi:hypothetical protein